MKFYLSSIGIKSPEEFYELAGKSSGIKTAFITNAFDYKSPEDKKVRIDLIVQELTRVGLDLHEINLRSYNNEPGRLKDDLLGFDVMWVCGGNVFLLRELMKRSGLDKVLGDVLESGVVYGGDSAGAIVVGPTLAGFERADHVDQVDEVIYEGLGLVNFVVVPHAGNPKFQQLLEAITKDLQNKEVPFEVINDEQAVVVDGGDRRIVG